MRHTLSTILIVGLVSVVRGQLQTAQNNVPQGGFAAQPVAAPQAVPLPQPAAVQQSSFVAQPVAGTQPAPLILPVAMAQPTVVAQPVLLGQPSVVAQPNILAQPGVAAQPGFVAQPGVVAQPGGVAQPGVVQQPGLLPQQAAVPQAGFAVQPGSVQQQNLFPQLYPQEVQYDAMYPVPLTDGDRLVGVAQKRLRACCRHLTTDVDYECKRRFCTFEAWNPANVFMFMSICSPRGTTVYELWDCASSRRDHTQCCIQKGVSEGCLSYCDATYGMATDSSQLLNCQTYLNPIRECFWEYMERNPNMHGEY